MSPLMRSELPEVFRTRHHWAVMFRLPGKVAGVGFLAMIVWALLAPAMWVVVIIVLLAVMLFRWQMWAAEYIVLTRKRILRVRGVPETTKSEAFLRLDRISGIRIVQSVPGKILDYATIELEAPGNHPDVRRLVKLGRPYQFYRTLRHLIFIDERPDPDDLGTPPGEITAPLPRLGGPFFRRRW